MKSAGHNSVYPAGLPRCSRLTGVLCMTTPPDLGDRRLFMPAFQVGRLRCARSRGLLDAKSHFTLALMSAGEWRGVRTGRWCLQMRTPQTTSHPDTRCWFDYGVASVWMYGAGEVVRSKSIKWNRDECHLYLFIFCPTGGVIFGTDKVFHNMEVFPGRSEVCFLTAEMRPCLFLVPPGAYSATRSSSFLCYRCDCTFTVLVVCVEIVLTENFIHEFSTLVYLIALQCLKFSQFLCF